MLDISPGVIEMTFAANRKDVRARPRKRSPSLQEILEDAPVGCWVALDFDEEIPVVAVGDDLDAALNAARRAGFDHPLVIEIPIGLKPKKKPPASTSQV